MFGSRRVSRCNSGLVGASAAQLQRTRPVGKGGPPPGRLAGASASHRKQARVPVSYTHLTLPTICSV
eukprot:3633195-Alexandrium_andersonii.AAC.1